MKTYCIHGEPVTLRVENNRNVLTYQREEYHIFWNGTGDGWIIINGKKRYLEEK